MREECIIRGEFAGELPQDMAAIFGPAVGHGSACVLYVQTQEADRHLGRLPRFLWLDGHRVTISRPAAQRQWSTQPGLAQPAPAARPARAPVTAAAAAAPGPRAIRLRHRASARLQQQPQQAGSPPSAQLQHLEASVAGGRTPGLDRTGLGHPAHAGHGAHARLAHATASATGAQHVAASRAAHAGARAAHADARAAQAEPLLAQQAAAMDVDVIEPAHQPAHPTAVGMEWDSGERAVSQAATRRRLSSPQASPATLPGATGSSIAAMEVDVQPERQPATAAASSCSAIELMEREGVPCTVVEHCMQWMETHVSCERHTDRVAILAEVHAAQPRLLQGAATDESYAEIHSRLAAAVRSRFGDAGAGERCRLDSHST